jgi:hypothetical protein
MAGKMKISQDEINRMMKNLKSDRLKKTPPIDVTNKKGMEEAIRALSMGKKMEMGGEVMDTTKSMPVGMMDGGKVKKMNMGGVIPGRGGMFKGMK